MIEDEARLTIADEIMKAVEIGDQDGTSVGHRFKRCQPKAFARFR